MPSASQAGWLARTRATVAATSAGPSTGTFAITDPSAGLITSNVSAVARDSPAVSIAMLTLLVKLFRSGL